MNVIMFVKLRYWERHLKRFQLKVSMIYVVVYTIVL